MKGYIYYIKQLSTNKYYIGQTTNIENRLKSHLCPSQYARTRWHKLVIDNPEDFIGDVIEIYDLPENELMHKLSERERYYVQYYDSYKNGFNTTRGGEYNTKLYMIVHNKKYKRNKNNKYVKKVTEKKYYKPIIETKEERYKRLCAIADKFFNGYWE